MKNPKYNKQYNIKISDGTKYPGDKYSYTICDICGRKFRIRDTILVNEKYNQLNGLVVCKQDYDPVDPQLLPIKLRKQKIHNNPKYVRTEDEETVGNITSIQEIEGGNISDSGSSPSSPRNLKTTIVLNSSIRLEWDFPLTSGSAVVTGYKIERESPVGGGFTTLVTNTNSYNNYYVDSSLSTSTQYNYKVSAINRFGTSSASNEANATTQA